MVSFLTAWFGKARPAGVDASYIALVAQARNPFFYDALSVPDTIDGRFEMIVLHLFLLQNRLLNDPQNTEFARMVSEAFFDDMDRTIREFGVMDAGVGKRVKRMGKAYHGRLQAYGAALADREALRAALARNLYGTIEAGDVTLLDGMIAYMQAQQATLEATDTATILAGDYAWPSPRK
jgi:cytochrome b pre-mRNA-processing protein 3